jgi:hypothetical protein
MAAACFPEAQKKVQEELDDVIGRERGRLSSLSIHFSSFIAAIHGHLVKPNLTSVISIEVHLVKWSKKLDYVVTI